MADIRLISRLALACCVLAAPLHAQQQISDPANLTGEHVSPQSPADTLPINHGAPALQQLLLKLRTRASMMLIVAHPDDEDGGFLTYESRGQGARVGMLTLTRGEGGQNLMTADFDDALGLIRTQELLAADRYMGVDQFFGTEVDFGFSKTKEETLAKWTHDRVLYDAVRCVRLYRPLVIASVFVGGPTDGHGHHQVAGEIAQEVFVAAADPKVFPEMGLPPWAPLKVYARVPFSRVTGDGMFDYATGKTIPVLFHNYVTGADSKMPPVATVQIHEGDPATAMGAPTLGMEGMTYVQFARQGLALQKTQIGQGVRVAPPGRSDTGYTLMASRLPSATSKGLSSFAVGGGSASRTGNDVPAEQSIFDGIDTSLPSIAKLAPDAPAAFAAVLQVIDAKLAEAQKAFDPAHLEAIAEPLRFALQTLDTVISGTEKSSLPANQKFNVLHELRIKRVQLNNALVLVLQLKLEPMTKQEHPTYAAEYTTIDRSIYTSVRLTNGSSTPINVVRLNSDNSNPSPSAAQGTRLDPGKHTFTESTYRYSTPPPPTRPYFSRPNIEQPFYNIAATALRNAPSTPDPLVSTASIDVQGTHLEVATVIPDGQTVLYRNAPAANLVGLPPPVPQPAVIVPPVSISIRRTDGLVTPTRESIQALSTPEQRRAFSNLVSRQATAGQLSAGILPIGQTSFQIGTNLSWEITEDSILGPAEINPDRIPVSLNVPPNWNVAPFQYFMKNTMPVTEIATVTPAPLLPNQTYTLTALATYNSIPYKESFRPVGYPGLTYTNYYTPATYRATAVDVTTAPGLKIAYIPGTGDDVPAYLPNLGVTPTLLTAKDLTLATLQQYDAVILGVRAYAAHPELAGAGSKTLMDYASNGGIVILQYMTAKYGDAEAPYPISVPGDSAHNVVVEAQPVSIIAPSAPLLNWPNKITSVDFHNWVAEYGHGFAASWSPKYEPLLEVHDPDQDPQKGGLLVAPVGKGAYIYCALALYRQLPEGVPGAYRLFANLLSYAKNPQR